MPSWRQGSRTSSTSAPAGTGSRDAFGQLTEPGWLPAGLPREDGSPPGRTWADLKKGRSRRPARGRKAAEPQRTQREICPEERERDSAELHGESRRANPQPSACSAPLRLSLLSRRGGPGVVVVAGGLIDDFEVARGALGLGAELGGEEGEAPDAVLAPAERVAGAAARDDGRALALHVDASPRRRGRARGPRPSRGARRGARRRRRRRGPRSLHATGRAAPSAGRAGSSRARGRTPSCARRGSCTPPTAPRVSRYGNASRTWRSLTARTIRRYAPSRRRVGREGAVIDRARSERR